MTNSVDLSEMIKYPSIENTYQQKYIDKWLSYHPELKDDEFIVTEKIHGANFQIMFTPFNQPLRYFSRNQEILPGEKFNNYQEALSEKLIQRLIRVTQEASNVIGKEIRIYGELFGGGIGKGIDYGFDKEKKYRIFDMMIGDKWCTPFKLLTGYEYRVFLEAHVPIIGYFNLQDALNYDVEKNSTFNTQKENNTWEGIVIKPYSKIYKDPNGSMFWLKKKSIKFEEKSHEKTVRPVDNEVDSLNKIFSEYFNDNRVQSCFSKMGEIQEPKQMQEYIKAILEDGKTDFMKEYADELEKLEKDQQRKVLNIGSKIAILLKKYL